MASDKPDNSPASTAAESGSNKVPTFRKRRLSLPKHHLQADATSAAAAVALAALESDSEKKDDEAPQTPNPAAASEEPQDDGDDDSKAQTFRKRRLSLTALTPPSAGDAEATSLQKRPRRLSESSVLSKDSVISSSTVGTLDAIGISNPLPSSNNNNNSNAAETKIATMVSLKPRIVHAGELLAHPPLSPSVGHPSNHRLYLPPDKVRPEPHHATINGRKHQPKWKKRHTRKHDEDERKLPFPRHVLGTFSCHGVEPVYDSDYEPEEEDEEDDDEDWMLPEDSELRKEAKLASPSPSPQAKSPSPSKTLTIAKINQDRGGIAFPYGNCPRTALFAVYDGHGQGGELVSQFALHEIQQRLQKHVNYSDNVQKAFLDTFIQVDEALKDEALIEPLYAGTTACVVLLRENTLHIANAGDSRAVLGRRNGPPLDLSQDQNPDVPEEQDRIERMGGYVSPSPEPGLSARVWLDAGCSQIGLAMARSIGDHAVKSVGVIAEPVVTTHVVSKDDDILIMATDGVWEFVSSEQAVDIVRSNIDRGATRACQALIEAAAARWHDEEGDYRDDITAIVIQLQHLWDEKEKQKK